MNTHFYKLLKITKKIPVVSWSTEFYRIQGNFKVKSVNLLRYTVNAFMSGEFHTPGFPFHTVTAGASASTL